MDSYEKQVDQALERIHGKVVDLEMALSRLIPHLEQELISVIDLIDSFDLTDRSLLYGKLYEVYRMYWYGIPLLRMPNQIKILYPEVDECCMYIIKTKEKRKLI